MFISFPKQPTLPGDGDWATTKIVLSSQIDSLYTREIKPFEDDSLNKYSQYSNNDNYKSAKLHLDKCREQLMGAKQIVDNDESVFRGICANNINEASNQMRLARECWESFMEDLKDSLPTLGSGNSTATPGSGGSSSTPGSGGSPSTPRSVGSTPKSGSGGSTDSTSSSSGKTKTGNGEKNEIKDNLWRLKINGKWAEGFEYKVGTGTPLKIQVYNGRNPVKVIWSWTPNVTVYTKGMQSNITELDNIEVSRRTQGKGSVWFWTKDNPQKKRTIYLLPDD